MGNKPHSAVVEYEQVLQKLTPDSIDSLAGYFSLAGAVSSSTSNTETLELSKKSFLSQAGGSYCRPRYKREGRRDGADIAASSFRRALERKV